MKVAYHFLLFFQEVQARSILCDEFVSSLKTKTDSTERKKNPIHSYTDAFGGRVETPFN